MKILVVDDEVVSRKKMLRILSGYGKCDSVDNGKAAMDAFKNARKRKAPYNLITLDISMPDMDGTTVLDRIRKTERVKSTSDDNRVKIIMVTSDSQKNTVVRSVKGGCDDYVVKPFNKEQIVQKLYKLNLLVDPTNNDLKPPEDKEKNE